MTENSWSLGQIETRLTNVAKSIGAWHSNPVEAIERWGTKPGIVLTRAIVMLSENVRALQRALYETEARINERISALEAEMKSFDPSGSGEYKVASLEISGPFNVKLGRRSEKKKRKPRKKKTGDS